MLDRLKYYWDNNQERYAKYYVYVKVESVGEVHALSGGGDEGGSSDDEDFFGVGGGDREEPSGDRVEAVEVTIKRFTEKGDQYQSPSKVELRRKSGGRC